MARPNWEYIRVDVLLPGHPKLAGLPRSARWTLIELWCFAGRYHTDGFISDDVWGETGPAADRRRLVERGLAERADGGWQMHDYTGHQRTREEIDTLSAKRSESGRRAAAVRWGSEGDTKSHSQRSNTTMRNASDPMPEAEAEADKDPPARGRAAPQGAARGTRLAADFAITAAMAAWAAENVPGIDFAAETMRFRDYWESKAGANARKTDWPATWRNWMRRAAETAPPRNLRPAGSHQPTHDEFEALRQSWARPLSEQEAEIDARGNGGSYRVHRNSLPAAEN